MRDSPVVMIHADSLLAGAVLKYRTTAQVADEEMDMSD